MALAAREVAERRAEALGGNDAQVHLQAAGELHARFGAALPEHALDLRQGHEGLHDGVALPRHDEQVGVADRLLAPSD